MSDAFDIKSKLSKLKPRTDVTPTTAEDESRLDAAAQRHEFVSREGGGRVKRQRSSEPLPLLRNEWVEAVDLAARGRADIDPFV
jgi:hypothetical protein